jgi:predicted TIM-barrel fold metal-dependent hydrolase
MTDSCWGDEWRENWQPAYGGPFPTVTPEDFDQAMSEIDVAIVFGMRATAANVATPNQRIADFCKATKTKTIGFMALDPNDEDVLEQMREGLSLGLRGIKLYPVLAHFDPREDRYRAFFEAVVRNDLALLWHMGASPSKRARLELSHPLLVDEVAKMYPKMIQIIAHIGHPWQRETILVLRKNSNVYADVSGAWARPFDGYHALVRAQEWNVVDKLLFGSDYPLWKPSVAVEDLHEIAKIRAGTLPFVKEETIQTILDQDVLSKLRLEL